MTQILEAWGWIKSTGACLVDLERCAPWLPWVIALCVALFIIGLLMRFRDFLKLVHKIASWPGVAAVIGVVVAIGTAIALAFRRNKETDDDVSQDVPDVDKANPRPRRPSILDRWKKGRSDGGGDSHPPSSLSG